MGRWDEFRYEPLAQEYDVGICADSATCSRKYSPNRHKKGFADPWGTIHWDRWHSSPTRKRGLHRLLTLIGVIKLKHHRRPNLQKWQALHEKEVWAQKEAQARFHLRFPISYSKKAREEAQRDVKWRQIPTRSLDMAAYQWMYAENYKRRS
jgi:hypothetical protein